MRQMLNADVKLLNFHGKGIFVCGGRQNFTLNNVVKQMDYYDISKDEWLQNSVLLPPKIKDWF